MLCPLTSLADDNKATRNHHIFYDSNIKCQGKVIGTKTPRNRRRKNMASVNTTWKVQEVVQVSILPYIQVEHTSQLLKLVLPTKIRTSGIPSGVVKIMVIILVIPKW
jgi:hypothetical protein